MFSVYSRAGRVFRGSMEQLRQVGHVGAVSRTRAVEAVGDDAGPALFNHPVQPVPVDEAHRVALAAYGQSPVRTRQPLTRVDALMTRKVVAVQASMTVMDAWKLLGGHAIGQAPVINEASTLVGLLSRAELMAQRELTEDETDPAAWRALLQRSVAELMWTPVPGVAPDTDIRRAAQVLLDTGLPGLPVTDDEGQVIGFLSRTDILRAVVTDPPLDLWG